VDNKGYDVKNDKWKQSIGKAKFVGEENVAMLKVSFFGPFMGV
jgi:apolipoprotein D and lipocalin family protein